MSVVEKDLDSALISYKITDKILTIKFKKGKAIDIKQAEEIEKVSSELTNNEVHVNFVDSSELLFISNSAKNFLSQKEKNTVKAIGILVHSRIQESMGNMYMRFSNPKLPTKLFTNKLDALIWLRTKL